MAFQFSVEVRNAMLDAFESTTGASALLQIRSGTMPGSCSYPATGTLLALLPLPADWMNAASGGSKTYKPPWQTGGQAAGVAGYFRILSNDGIYCTMQGTVSGVGGGGDLILDSTSITYAGQVTVLEFTITAPNA